MPKILISASLVVASIVASSPEAAQSVSYDLCTPGDNLFADSCIGTLASTALGVKNDAFGFFLGRQPTYTETDVLSGIGDRRLREYGASDWTRISEVWGTQGAALSTNLSYPVPLGGDPLLAEGNARALLSTGSLGVATRNHGLSHSPSNVYSLVATSYAWIAEVITVVAPSTADSVSVRISLNVTGSILESGPSLGSFAYASAQLGVSNMLGGSPSGGQSDFAEFNFEGSVLDTLTVVATAVRPAGIPMGTPFSADFRIAGRLNTGVVNTQYPYAIDFGRTATFGVEIPAGATWSSHSGLFLTQPVPEPGMTSLLALGLVILVTIGRRRLKMMASGSVEKR